MFNGYINYRWAVFNSKLLVYQRVSIRIQEFHLAPLGFTWLHQETQTCLETQRAAQRCFLLALCERPAAWGHQKTDGFGRSLDVPCRNQSEIYFVLISKLVLTYCSVFIDVIFNE